MATTGHVQGESLGARRSAKLGGRNRTVRSFFFHFPPGSIVQSRAWLKLAPGIAFLTTGRQKPSLQGRSFGTEWWTSDVEVSGRWERKKKTRAAASRRF